MGAGLVVGEEEQDIAARSVFLEDFRETEQAGAVDRVAGGGGAFGEFAEGIERGGEHNDFGAAELKGRVGAL